MEPSKARDLLRRWEAATSQAVRPEAPPLRNMVHSGVSLRAVTAAALLLLVLAGVWTSFRLRPSSDTVGLGSTPSPVTTIASSLAPPPSTPIPTAQQSGSPSPPPPTAPAASPIVLPLRTFKVWKLHNGVPVSCDSIGVDHPLFGYLVGDAGNRQEPVWLRAPNGSRLSIVWPQGFTAILTSDGLAIADETGATVIRPGDAVEAQVSRSSAAGSFDDPYYASGILIAGHFTLQDVAHGITFQGCYPRKAG